MTLLLENGDGLDEQGVDNSVFFKEKQQFKNSVAHNIR